MNTATHVRDLTGFTGRAALYRMEPPHAGTEFVVASATTTDAWIGNTETYLFPATPEGMITDWGQLPGSLEGTLDHREALEAAGYEVRS